MIQGIQNTPYPEDILRERPKDYSLTLAKGIAVLEMFGPDHQTVNYQSVAKHLSTSRATARRLILTLKAMGYLESNGGDYALTEKPLAISRSLMPGNSILSILNARVRSLAAKVDCSCSVVCLDGPDVMILSRDASRGDNVARRVLGDRLPAHASSGGKILISAFSDSDIVSWFKQHRPQSLCSRTITNSIVMLKSAAQFREQGYAVSNGELEDGMVSLGLPIHDHLGQIRLALVISQRSEFDRVDAFVDGVLNPACEAAKNISEAYADYTRLNH